MSTSFPLEGVRVLDLTRLVPGPYATRVLAELGADIIKIEAPQGGDYVRWWPPMSGDPPMGSTFRELNYGKQSVALDLKTEAGREAFGYLLEEADVLVDGFRPGVLARLGLDPDALRKDHPRLIYCAITGFGLDGPDAQRAGHDIGYMARAGALGLSGTKESPQTIGVQVADIGSAMLAVSGILAALYRREKTGQGGVVDVALVEAGLAFNAVSFGRLHAGEEPVRGEELLDGSRPCYQVYETKDGRHLAVGALEPKFWAAFLQAVELPELMGEGLSTGSQAEAAHDQIQARLREKTLAEWRTVFSKVDACVEPILTLSEVESDPHLVARGAVDPAGFVRSPLRLDGDRPALSAPPQLGADTDGVLRAAGVPQALVDKLSVDSTNGPK